MFQNKKNAVKTFVTAVPHVEECVGHIPSIIHADTLFTFMGKLEYLLEVLNNKIVAARYCDEDISYLKINGLAKIACPMKCFCDINLHRLSRHLDFYGHFGIAFTKQWGMERCIQPIQYMNQKSLLCKDFAEAFNIALSGQASSTDEKAMKDMLLHQLLYMKPYSGKSENRETHIIEEKCFMDECEWRFVPNVAALGLPIVVKDQVLIEDKKQLNDWSNAIKQRPEAGLTFQYEDIKYIIVKTKEDREDYIREINKLRKMKPLERDVLISKLIVWEESKGDF